MLTQSLPKSQNILLKNGGHIWQKERKPPLKSRNFKNDVWNKLKCSDSRGFTVYRLTKRPDMSEYFTAGLKDGGASIMLSETQYIH